MLARIAFCQQLPLAGCCKTTALRRRQTSSIFGILFALPTSEQLSTHFSTESRLVAELRRRGRLEGRLLLLCDAADRSQHPTVFKRLQVDGVRMRYIRRPASDRSRRTAVLDESLIQGIQVPDNGISRTDCSQHISIISSKLFASSIATSRRRSIRLTCGQFWPNFPCWAGGSRSCPFAVTVVSLAG